MMARKRVCDYELTLARSSMDKKYIFYALSDITNGLIVSLEYHSDRSVHYHCYLELNEKMLICELRDVIIELLIESLEDDVEEGGGEVVDPNIPRSQWGAEAAAERATNLPSIHLSALRNKRCWITYITKEDEEPLYKNVNVSGFHFNFKMRNYVKNNEIFNPLDTFVLTYVNYTNIIQRAHAYYWSNQALIEYANEELYVVPLCTVKWVADAMFAFEKLANIFVHGSTGIGKSVLAKFLSRKFKPTDVVYLPCRDSGFEFSSINKDTRLVIAEDVGVKWLEQHRQQLLIGLDKGVLAINVKCSSILQVRIKAQFIILSNFPPVADPALYRRLTVIEALEDGFQKVNKASSDNDEAPPCD